MVETFLEYLTLPNPELDVTNCKPGSLTSIERTYVSKREVYRWQDVNIENLKSLHGEVLSERMDAPKVESARDISPRRKIIYAEDSVNSLAERWNEIVVEHALRGTQKKLCIKEPDGPLGRGNLRFMRNDGRADIAGKNKRKQKPDWFFYQVGQDEKERTKLVIGEAKPAIKWKSGWINSNNKSLEKRGLLALQQVAKYMWLERLRYGFLLTDEELVAVQLWQVSRDRKKATMLKKMRDQAASIAETAKDFRTRRHKSLEDSLNSSQMSNPQVVGSLTDSPHIELALEYRPIPWTNKGVDNLTVNLTLWWLPMLAMEDPSLKSSGNRVFSKEHARDSTPFVEIDETEGQSIRQNQGDEALEAQQVQDARKRRRDESEESAKPRRRSTRRGRYVERDLRDVSIASRQEPASARITRSKTRAAATAGNTRLGAGSTSRPRQSQEKLVDSRASSLTIGTSQSTEQYHLSFSHPFSDSFSER